MGWIAALWLAFGVCLPCASCQRGTYFSLLRQRKVSKRKATPTCRSASQTSLTPHPFFGACELAALRASSDKRTLVSEKRMLRSAERRLYGSCKPLIFNLYIYLQFLWMQQTTGTFARTCLVFASLFFAIFTRNAAYHFLSCGYELAL